MAVYAASMADTEWVAWMGVAAEVCHLAVGIVSTAAAAEVGRLALDTAWAAVAIEAGCLVVGAASMADTEQVA